MAITEACFGNKTVMHISTYNVYLSASADSKGGGLFLEDPASVTNIVLQTAACEPDEFESRLADQLMIVFGAGAWELVAVVAELNSCDCFDRAGQPWTVESLQAQLAHSASRLFGAKEILP